MKREYDFSKGVRGKFYRKGAELRLPIYLDAKVQGQLERLAEQNGKDIGEMVNQLVRKEIRSIEETRASR
jgi:cytidylate kinase